jgi:hypothetical protein
MIMNDDEMKISEKIISLSMKIKDTVGEICKNENITIQELLAALSINVLTVIELSDDPENCFEQYIKNLKKSFITIRK